MNELFKKFKKKYGSSSASSSSSSSSSSPNKSTQQQPATIADLLKEVSEKDDDELNETYGNFDRANRSYLSISKSGRIKSKNSYQSRNLKDDLFASPSEINTSTRQTLSSAMSSSSQNTKPCKMNMFNKYYSSHSSTNSTGESSTSDSFQSSMEDINY